MRERLSPRPLDDSDRLVAPVPEPGPDDESDRARAEPAPLDGNGRDHSTRRVLIVDDEPAIRLVCRLNLESAGFETLEAGDGATALDLAQREHPDVILLDVMLPNVDGWQVAQELAAEPETREIPVLFLSARSDRADELRGHELGGVGYVTKPFDPAALTGRVGGAVDRARRGELDEMRREWAQALNQ